MIKIAIVGSRRRSCEREVRKLVKRLCEAHDKQLVILSGGARGPDTWAEKEARRLGICVKVFHPKKRGVGYKWACRAYTERNERIAKNADRVYAFVSRDRKGGTEQTIKFARKYGKPVVIL